MARKLFRIWCMVLLIAAAALAVVQAEEAGEQSTGEQASQERSIYFPAGFTLEGDLFIAEGTETERVRITLEDTVLYAQKVIYNDEESWAELEGDVLVEREGMVITAAKATLAIDDDSYIFEGDVYMNDTKASTPRKIWADLIEYHGETGNLTAEGNVRMEEEKRSFSAKRMVYDAENEKAQLEGDVLVHDERGTINAQSMEIDLEQESFSGSGPGQIVLSSQRKSSGESDDAASNEDAAVSEDE